MAKVSGKNAIILVNGINYSTMAFSLDGEDNAGMIDVTGFTEGGQNFIPGLPSGKLSIGMYWDSTATVGSSPVFGAFPTGNVTVIPNGYALGNQSLSMPFMMGNYAPHGEPAGSVQLGTLNFEAYGSTFRGIEHGWMLAHATITATTTGTGVLDPADAAVTAVCGATLHIWTACAADTYVVKVQHSSDNNTFADLVTFVANGSAITTERQVIASGTINKYRRVLATRTGAAANPFGYSVHFWHA